MTQTVSEKIEKAFGAGGATSQLVHLSVEEADTFIDYIVDESSILKEARVVKMNKPTKDIAKIGIGTDILYPGSRGTALGSDKYAVADPGMITLESKLMRGAVKILDDELEDNIEGDAFKDHMMRMVSKKASNQLERSGLYGRILTGATDTDHLFDGWITRITNGGNAVDAADTGSYADRYISKTKLADVYKSIPTKFRKTLDRIYMPNDLMVDYEVINEALQNRISLDSAFKLPFTNVPGLSIERPFVVVGGISTTTTAGTTANGTNATIAVTSATGITAGKILVLGYGTANEQVVTVLSVASLVVTLTAPVAINVLSGATVKECVENAADVLITAKNNLIRGIQREITIEPERKASESATYMHITMRCDFQVEEVTASGILYNALVK